MDIQEQQETAYDLITEILLHLGDDNPGMDDIKKTNCMFNVLEVILAEAIAEASTDKESLKKLAKQCHENIVKTAESIQKERAKEPAGA